MKKKALMTAIALSMVIMPVQAAEWKEGLGPEKPYSGVPEIDLDENMGYVMTYPRDKMPAEHFCDALEMYLPRVDIVRGSGEVSISDENGVIYTGHFENPDEVDIRPLTETEMEGLMWGSGTCVSIKLPVSLDFGKTYQVNMDEGAFTAANGAVTNLPIKGEGNWTPVLTGDFGIANLSYRRAVEGEEDGEETEETSGVNEAVEITPGTAAADTGSAAETAAETTGSDATDMFASLNAVSNSGASDTAASGDASADTASAAAPAGDDAAAADSADEAESEADSYGEPTLKPLKDDKLVFDLVVGGDVVKAVPYSENGSVLFDSLEYSTSQTVVADIIGNEVEWGIVFLNADGDVLDVLQAKF